MLKNRIVVTLCHDGKGNAVKPVSFDKENRRVVGNIIQIAKNLSNRNIDELVVMDITATEEEREHDYDTLREIASVINCPLTAGGGIYELSHVRKMLNNGADKILLGKMTNDTKSHTTIPEIAKVIGAQSVCVHIDYHCQDCLTKAVMELLHIMVNMNRAGVGEFILTNKELDGTMKGYDTIAACIAGAASFPVVLNGGCGTKEHIEEVFKLGTKAVGVSSMFLYTETTPRDCTEYLAKKGYPVRNDPVMKAWQK